MAKQCAALTASGTRCRNAPVTRGKYCGAHKGWRPTGTNKKRLDALAKARRMKEVRRRAASAPGGKGPIRNRPAATRVLGGTARCAAKTSRGTRCKRLPRTGSKYCTTHKGGR